MLGGTETLLPLMIRVLFEKIQHTKSDFIQNPLELPTSLPAAFSMFDTESAPKPGTKVVTFSYQMFHWRLVANIEWTWLLPIKDEVRE